MTAAAVTVTSPSTVAETVVTALATSASFTGAAITGVVGVSTVAGAANLLYLQKGTTDLFQV